MTTEQTKHTPGPWKFRETSRRTLSNEVTAQSYAISTEGEATFYGKSIAVIHAIDSTDENKMAKYSNEECIANAALIASAPALLTRVEELEAENKRLKEELSNSGSSLSMLRMAIDQAETPEAIVGHRFEEMQEEIETLKEGVRQNGWLLSEKEKALVAKDRELFEVTKRKEDLSGALRFKVGELEKEREQTRVLREALEYARKRAFNMAKNLRMYAVGASEQEQERYANEHGLIKAIDAVLSQVTTPPVGPRPSDFAKVKPFGSVLQKSEAETVAHNIILILARTGDTFRKLEWEEYEIERKKDGNFSNAELMYFINVSKHCVSADTAVLFAPSWSQVTTPAPEEKKEV